MADKTQCITCGKTYKVCPRCGDAAWRKTACSPVCWQISQIINQHFYHVIDAQQAAKELKNVNYERVRMNEASKNEVDKILEEAAAAKPKRRRATAPHDDSHENA